MANANKLNGIDVDLSDTQQEEPVQMAQKYSPVFNSVAKPIPISVLLES